MNAKRIPDFGVLLAKARRKLQVYNEQLKWDEYIVRQVLAEVTLEAREELTHKQSPRWARRKRARLRAALRAR